MNAGMLGRSPLGIVENGGTGNGGGWRSHPGIFCPQGTAAAAIALWELLHIVP